MPQENVDVSHIAGNVSDEIKRKLSNPGEFYKKLLKTSRTVFGESIHRRLRVTELSVYGKAEEPRKLEGRAVLETEVAEDMANGGGNIHGGCIAHLVDICSSLAVTTLNLASTGRTDASVSQSLNIVYHSPAGLGDTIRIVNTTLTLGSRALSARTEIWNVTHHRLVASGVHIKMAPSSAPRAGL